MSRRCAAAWLALAVMVLAGAPALAASKAIYKCIDNHLGVVYTDLPCQDGEELDIRAGDADAAAVARLERERDRLDESSAQRLLDERRAARSAPAAWLPAAAEEDASAQAMAVPLGYGYVIYPPFVPRPPHQPRPPPPPDVHRFAPDPPYPVPRL